MGNDLFYIKKAYMGNTPPYIAPIYEKKKRFGGEHLGPIYGSTHIWAPYMKRRKAVRPSPSYL
jgi:hypothetical protein